MHVFVVTGSSNAGKSSLIRALTGVKQFGDWTVGQAPNGIVLPIIVFTASLGVEHIIKPDEFIKDLEKRRIGKTRDRKERKFCPNTKHLLVPLRTDKPPGHPMHANQFLAAFQVAGWTIQNPIVHVQEHVADVLAKPADLNVLPVPGHGVHGAAGWNAVAQGHVAQGHVAQRVPANFRAARVRQAWGWM